MSRSFSHTTRSSLFLAAILSGLDVSIGLRIPSGGVKIQDDEAGFESLLDIGAEELGTSITRGF